MIFFKIICLNANCLGTNKKSKTAKSGIDGSPNVPSDTELLIAKLAICKREFPKKPDPMSITNMAAEVSDFLQTMPIPKSELGMRLAFELLTNILNFSMGLNKLIMPQLCSALRRMELSPVDISGWNKYQNVRLHCTAPVIVRRYFGDNLLTVQLVLTGNAQLFVSSQPNFTGRLNYLRIQPSGMNLYRIPAHMTKAERLDYLTYGSLDYHTLVSLWECLEINETTFVSFLKIHPMRKFYLCSVSRAEFARTWSKDTATQISNITDDYPSFQCHLESHGKAFNKGGRKRPCSSTGWEEMAPVSSQGWEENADSTISGKSLVPNRK